MADTAIDTDVETTLWLSSIRSGPVWVSTTNAYVFYQDSNADFVYSKTADGGGSWSAATVINAGAPDKMSIWYDDWTTGDTGTEIHLAYLDATENDIFYRSLDTSDDTLSTEITAFAGVSFRAGAWNISTVDITKARGGNLYIAYWGDFEGENGVERSTDGGATWGARATHADGNAVDGILLFPGNETDTDDIWAMYWDRSADEISLKIYDNSGDSWSETSVSTGMADATAFNAMSGAQRQSDNHVILAAWNELDATTADLKVWDIGGSGSITAKTDVVSNSAESAQVAVFINQQNDDIYVAYLKGGTWLSLVDLVFRKSTDGGGSWGTEQAYSEASADDIRVLWAGHSVGDDGGKFQPCWFNDDLGDLLVNTVKDIEFAAAVAAAVIPNRIYQIEQAIERSNTF